MNLQEWNEISGNYYEEVLSPIKNADSKELLEDIKKESSRKSCVLEVGCGIGELIPLLSKNFKRVKAIDFSPGMIKEAKANNKGIENVEFRVADMKNIGEKKKYGVVISINSLLTPSIEEINVIIQEIYDSIEPGGIFIGVLPSMESYLYQSMLEADKEIRKGMPTREAMSAAANMIEGDKKETVLGITGFGGAKQKAFYDFEIEHRFKQAGFKNVEIKKIKYKWKEWEEAGQKKYSGSEPPWDWHIKCKKPR